MSSLTELLTCCPTPEKASVAPLVALITCCIIGIAPDKHEMNEGDYGKSTKEGEFHGNETSK